MRRYTDTPQLQELRVTPFYARPFRTWQFQRNSYSLTPYTAALLYFVVRLTITPIGFGVSFPPHTITPICFGVSFTPLRRFTATPSHCGEGEMLMAQTGQQAWAMTQIRFICPPDFLVPRDIKNVTSASQPGGRRLWKFLFHSLAHPPAPPP